MPARGNIRVHGNRDAVGALAALICALIALAAMPAAAAARPITVDSIGDQSGAGRCAESAPAGECTLRAAIEASNTDTTLDQIQFNGVQGEELEPESALPPLIRPVEVSGSLEFNGSYYAPKVGITAPPGAAALTVEADDVIVEGLALGGGTAGIEVVGESTGLLARGNWLGLKLDTEANEGTVAGIVLRPGSDAAEIGSEEHEALRRNVFGHDEVGVLIEGASETKVLGNYIGVGPDGNGPATLGVGVNIVDGLGAPAERNEVGGTLTEAEAESTVCDGPCNVIATDGGTDIDLTGEPGEPASGPTMVRGNYLGLAADGLRSVGENSSGVEAAPGPGHGSCGGGPGDVTVGGTAPTESNYIDAGNFGIFAEGAENFRALGNSIGLLADGSPGESPNAFGIEACAEGVTEPAQISNNNLLLGSSAFGIVSQWGRAEISGNRIQEGQVGVLAGADSEGHGDLIKGNTVTAPEFDGVQIQSQSNTVIGNTISGAGQAGIDLEEADQNRVGGDLESEENGIECSGFGAILISGSKVTRDEVRGNRGSGNAGPFIQLLEGEPGERPNAAVEPPTFATALQSTATGTAKPDSTVRIFSKASGEPGELASLLEVVHADATTGVWSATYATVPVGTLVAATETSIEGATSEVSEPTAASADPVKPIEPEEHAAGNGSSSSSGVSSSNPPISPKPPKVKITKHPVKTSKSTIATFKFKAIPAVAAKFQCKLDNAKWASCKSPKTYKNLKPRKHTFQVRATVSGLTGLAAKFKFTVKR